MQSRVFENRHEAGRQLAEQIAAGRFENPVVYALPRGGAPIGAEIASRLGAPLDLLLVRKIGAPGHEELAVGAIVNGEQPDIVRNADILEASGMGRAQFDAACARALVEIARRRALYLEGAPPVPARGATAILVDDGVATGASMRAALEAIRRRGPKRVIVATTVAARDTVRDLEKLADQVFCLLTPDRFESVGQHYRDFRQLSDEDVVRVMRAARAPHAGPGVSA
jgi:putative phosphoribosyl transferase